MMPAFKSTQVAYPIAAHIYLSLSMMMMSTFMVCDSINLNAQCNGTENRKLRKLTHTHTKTHGSKSLRQQVCFQTSAEQPRSTFP